MAKIRKGDEVVVIAGSEVGRRGRVLHVDRKKGRVTVEKVRIIKRHVRPSQKHPQGGIIDKEGSIHISNVQLWDPEAGAGARTRVEERESGAKVRVSVKSGKALD